MRLHSRMVALLLASVCSVAGKCPEVFPIRCGMGLIGVIGAGPAGCAAAHRLALLGHECVLFGRREKKRGVESISPGARHFLQMMQIPDALERIGVPARSKLLKWSSD